MSSFKNFRVWMGWFTHKYFNLSLLIAFLALGCGVAGFMWFWGFRLLGMTDNPAVPSNSMLGIVFAIGGIGVYVFYSFAVTSSHPSKNWRVAIEDVIRFQKKHPECKAKMEDFIRRTKDTKDGNEVNEWMLNYTKLLDAKRKLQRLEDEEKKLPIQIENKKEEIRDLESKLGYY